MKTKNIKVRKEVVLCSKCKKANNFLYLSDFAYGEKLIIYGEKRQYAYINLFEDDLYSKHEMLVSEILKNHNIKITKEFLLNAVNTTFGITCDKISGCAIDFNPTKHQCEYCSSSDFDVRLVEPETLVDVEIPLITHNSWMLFADKEKIELIENELIDKKIIQ